MYHAAIDIGGTFTDCAIMDDRGQVVSIGKSPSTRHDPSQGVLGSLTVAAEPLGLSLDGLLAQTELLIHGCTVATNAMVERTGVPTGLITTRGHEDAIIIGNVIQKVAGLSEREILHQSRLSKARPLVRPEHIFGVRERIDADGEVVSPLVLDDVQAAAEKLLAEGISSVAVSFLWSFRNPEHERKTVEFLAERYPRLNVVASSEVAPVLGEYERTVTAVLNAYLGPRVVGYLERLADHLARGGYQRELLLSHCMGGLTTLNEVRRQPLLTLDSGPAGGVLGARYFGGVYGEPNVLCTDMGGTTFDVSLIEHGEFSLDEQPVLDKYSFLVPKVAISSIGAGGGSIIWVDPDGILKVGPQSAGADPGPASYGHGGTEPTVTDADLLLGYLDSSSFLGGRQPLRRDLAEQAIARIGRQANMDPVEAAAGAFQIVNSQMADLIRQTTVEKGYDPRQFALFAYGGAAPTHAAYYARELRMKRIYVPRYSTVFSALGMLTGGVVHTFETSVTHTLPLAGEAETEVRRQFGSLEERIMELFRREGRAQGVRLRKFAYVKYRLQPRALAVPFDDQPLSELVETFEARYAEIYGQGSGYRQAGVELVKIRVDGILEGVTPDIAGEKTAPKTDASSAIRGERSAYFQELGKYTPTPVYDGAQLHYGNLLAGPCIVERMGDTIVIPPDVGGEVDRFQNLVFHLGEATQHSPENSSAVGARQ